MNSKITSEKALNVLLYVAEGIQQPKNMYKVLKAIYYADKMHLEKYGRQIFKQKYQKLDYGNVPADSYDVITHVRDNKSQPRMPERVKSRLRVQGKDTVTPLDHPNLDYLSKSERECLDAAIQVLLPLSFDETKKFLHDDDPAYHNDVKVNKLLSLEEHIVPKLKDGDKILEYLRDPHP